MRCFNVIDAALVRMTSPADAASQGTATVAANLYANMRGAGCSHLKMCIAKPQFRTRKRQV